MRACTYCRKFLSSADALCPDDQSPGVEIAVDPLPFELESRFGMFEPFAAGATGTLWRGRDDAVNVTVALKLLSAEQGVTAAERARTRRELRKQLTLEHAHVPPVYDEGEIAGRLWFARQFVPGDTLALRMRREGVSSVPDALAIVAQLASALDALHRQGLSHRDLKPGHVVFRKQAGREVVQLFDAGIVCIEERYITGVAYSAPEVIAGAQANFRSDLYALGCLCYELLTGTAPLAETAAEAVLAAPKTHYPPVLAHDFPAPVRTLLASMLAKDPRRRPFSAQQVRRALDPYLPAWVPVAPLLSAAPAAPTPSVPTATNNMMAATDTLGTSGTSGPTRASRTDEADMPNVPNMSNPASSPHGTNLPVAGRGQGVSNVARVPPTVMDRVAPATPSRADATMELGPDDLESAILAAESGRDASLVPPAPDRTQELDLADIDIEGPANPADPKARERAIANFAAAAIARVRKGFAPKKAAAESKPALAAAATGAAARPPVDDDDAPTIALSLAARSVLSGDGFASGAREVRESTPQPAPTFAASASAVNHDDNQTEVLDGRHEPHEPHESQERDERDERDEREAEAVHEADSAHAYDGAEPSAASQLEAAVAAEQVDASGQHPAHDHHDDHDHDHPHAEPEASEPRQPSEPSPLSAADSAPTFVRDVPPEVAASTHPGRRPQPQAPVFNTLENAAYDDELEAALSRNSFAPLSDSGMPDDLRTELRASHRPPLTQSPNLVLLGAGALLLVAFGVRLVRGPTPEPAASAEQGHVATAPEPVAADPALADTRRDQPPPTAAAPAAEAVPPPSAAPSVAPANAMMAADPNEAAADNAKPPANGNENSDNDKARGAMPGQTLSAADATRGLSRGEVGALNRPKQAPESDPKTRARVLYQERKFREAAAVYEEAAAQDAADAAAFAGLGASWLGADDAAKAVAAYERAVQLKPSVSGFQAALGRAYLAKGDRVRAQSAYSRALELDPSNQAARTGVVALQVKAP